MTANENVKTDWSPEDAFVSGIEIGFRAAEVILRQGGGLPDIIAERRKLEDRKTQKLRRGNGRPMAEGDIYEITAIAHPADFGLPWSELDTKQSAASRVRERA